MCTLSRPAAVFNAISDSKYQRPLKFKMGAVRQMINSVQNSKSMENRKNCKIAKETFTQNCKKRLLHKIVKKRLLHKIVKKRGTFV